MNLPEALADLVARGHVLVGVDFDGTLAPLVAHPDLAVPDPRALEHLRTLAASDKVEVAVVSGRSLTDLEGRLGDVPGAVLVGEHGNDMGEDTTMSEVIAEATGFLESLRQGRDATIENKRQSVTFHTRVLSDTETEEVADRVRAWVETHPEVTLLEGKEVFELTTATRTKGQAILDLGRDTDGIVYIGDDQTDETVFAVLRPHDIGVKVGPGPTAAGFRVADVAAVVELLQVAALAST